MTDRDNTAPPSAAPLPGVPLVDVTGRPLRLGVLVSGGGTNLQAILDAQKALALARGPALAGGAPALVGGVLALPVAFEVVVVVSNVDGVLAMHRANTAGVKAVFEDHRKRSREEFEAAVQRHLEEARVDVVVLAGFMRVLTASFLTRWPRKVVNVHPALCPAFPGMHAAKQALDHGARITGCTVHLVDAGVDTGPILAQAAVPILDDDDEDKLQKRIQKEEHRLLPEVLAGMARGRVRVVGDGKVRYFTGS